MPSEDRPDFDGCSHSVAVVFSSEWIRWGEMGRFLATFPKIPKLPSVTRPNSHPTAVEPAVCDPMGATAIPSTTAPAPHSLAKPRNQNPVNSARASWRSFGDHCPSLGDRSTPQAAQCRNSTVQEQYSAGKSSHPQRRGTSIDPRKSSTVHRLILRWSLPRPLPRRHSLRAFGDSVRGGW